MILSLRSSQSSMSEGVAIDHLRVGKAYPPGVGEDAGILDGMHRKFRNIGGADTAVRQPSGDAHAGTQAREFIDDPLRAFRLGHASRIDAKLTGYRAIALRGRRKVEADDVFQQQRVALAMRHVEEAAERMRQRMHCAQARIRERQPGLQAGEQHVLARRQVLRRGDGPFDKVRIWYRQFYNPRAKAETWQKRVNGRYTTRGTSNDPWDSAA